MLSVGHTTFTVFGTAVAVLAARYRDPEPEARRTNGSISEVRKAAGVAPASAVGVSEIAPAADGNRGRWRRTHSSERASGRHRSAFRFPGRVPLPEPEAPKARAVPRLGLLRLREPNPLPPDVRGGRHSGVAASTGSDRRPQGAPRAGAGRGPLALPGGRTALVGRRRSRNAVRSEAPCTPSGADLRRVAGGHVRRLAPVGAPWEAAS